MAKLSIKVPAQTTSIDRDNLYLDVKNMDILTKEIDTTISSMIKTLTSVKEQFSRLEKHFTSTKYKKTYKKALNNVEAETNKLKTRKKGLASKYESDRNDIKVSVLEGKIAELEKTVNAITGKDTTTTTTTDNNTSNSFKVGDATVESNTVQEGDKVRTTTVQTRPDGTKLTTITTQDKSGQWVTTLNENLNTEKGTMTTIFPNGEVKTVDIKY